MSELKRDLIKYCRDKAKSAYKKGPKCEICGSNENLEFHHYHSMTEMLTKWMTKNKIKINTADEIMSVRDTFIEEHYNQIYNETVTLCKTHHLKLHAVYGKRPSLATSGKQMRWVEKQKEKLNALV